MSTAIPYRQTVSEFRARIESLLKAGPPEPGSRRIIIDTTGSRTRRAPSKSQEDCLAQYGHARHVSVARILALFEIMREVERPRKSIGTLEVTPVGAIWQAYKGTTDVNACHTCPSLLRVGSELPSQFTANRGLQRHIVVEFGDCMLMPRTVNEADIFVDEAVGRDAFAMAAGEVLNRRDVGWREGLAIFRARMRQVLGPVGQLLLFHGGERIVRDDPDDQALLDALTAYYEGLYLRTVSENEMRNFIAGVRSEVGA